jgi:predicted aspartyl protease
MLRLRKLHRALPSRLAVAIALLGVTTVPMRAAPLAEIPFTTRDGRVTLNATVNGAGPWRFLLDTGYELVMLNPQHAQQLGLRRVGGVTIVGISGEERADRYAGAVFDFGGAQFTPRSVAALPSDARRRGRDGVLGSAFFRRFVVELDWRAGHVRLHEPATFQYPGRGEVVPLSFHGEVPVVDAQLTLGAHPAAPARLKIDTGCDGGVCLGSRFVQQHGWQETAKNGAGTTRSGVGGGSRTRQVKLSRVALGNTAATGVSAHLFEDTAPGDAQTAGHLGAEALKQFTVILDYSRRRMILENAPVAPARPNP